MFASIAKRFEGQVLPAHFEKLLVREHQVSPDFASRIVGYFTEGAKESGIIAPDGTVNSNPQNITGEGALDAGDDLIGRIPKETEVKLSTIEVSTAFVRGYTIRITGPGIDTTVAIKDEEDLAIVEVTLKKVRKLLKTQQDPLLA